MVAVARAVGGKGAVAPEEAVKVEAERGLAGREVAETAGAKKEVVVRAEAAMAGVARDAGRMVAGAKAAGMAAVARVGEARVGVARAAAETAAAGTVSEEMEEVATGVEATAVAAMVGERMVAAEKLAEVHEEVAMAGVEM
eukprot:scaffold328315_cov71-Tisochrysis_lutea.AAC.1